MRRGLRLLGLTFVVAWVVHTMVITGFTLLGPHYFAVLRTSPQTIQASSGRGYQQVLVRLGGSLSPRDSVLMVAKAEEEPLAEFSAAYWTYPRALTVATDLGAVDSARPSVVVFLQDLPLPPIQPPAGYIRLSSEEFPDNTRVTVFRRADG